MKKYIIFLLALFLVGCNSSDSNDNTVFTQDKAVPFELVHYEEVIAPVYASMVPYIAYAKTEDQFNLLKSRFDLDDAPFDVDMEKNVVAFVVTYSSSCGIALDGVYDDQQKLVVQLLEPTVGDCEPTQEPHTFVISTPKAAYEKAQLYIGNVIKASIEAK